MDDIIMIKINVMIGKTLYPLTINRSEEEIVRKAVKQINEKLSQYQTEHPGLELEKVMAMLLLELATDNLSLERKNDTEPFSKKIKELTERLDNYLEKN